MASKPKFPKCVSGSSHETEKANIEEETNRPSDFLQSNVADDLVEK